MQTTVFFIGQVVINNIDILLVKALLRPAKRGLYAAVALVDGFFISRMASVSAMFPSAQHLSQTKGTGAF